VTIFEYAVSGWNLGFPCYIAVIMSECPSNHQEDFHSYRFDFLVVYIKLDEMKENILSKILKALYA